MAELNWEETHFSYLPKRLGQDVPAAALDKDSSISQNVIVHSPRRSGKTVLSLLFELPRANEFELHPQIIILCSTTDLALQAGKTLEQMGKFSPNIKFTTAIFNGRKLEQGEKVREQIVLGTPGIVLDWILKKKALDPTKIVLLVVDQADVFITTQGYQDQTIRISKTLNKECQRALLSATYDEAVEKFGVVIAPNAVICREEEGGAVE